MVMQQAHNISRMTHKLCARQRNYQRDVDEARNKNKTEQNKKNYLVTPTPYDYCQYISIYRNIYCIHIYIDICYVLALASSD